MLQILVAGVLLIGLIQLWQTSLLQGQQLLKSQTQKMARLLVQQTAYGAAPALQLQDNKQLQWLASALVQDPKVMSASIYSAQGKRLAFAQSVTEQTFDINSEEMTGLLEQYSPFVEPVLQDDKNLGYVEVRLDKSRFFDHIKEAHQLNMQQQQLMLVIAGLIGLLLSRSMSFKRADFDRRKTRAKLRRKNKKLLDKPTVTDNETNDKTTKTHEAHSSISQSILNKSEARASSEVKSPKLQTKVDKSGSVGSSSTPKEKPADSKISTLQEEPEKSEKSGIDKKPT
nr:AhpA/YtjB family protein [Shewanella gelidii]